MDATENPLINLFNVCDAWGELPYPFHEMPAKLMESFIVILDEKRKSDERVRSRPAGSESMR